MILKALACYAIAFLLPIAAIFTIFVLFKNKSRLSVLHMFAGAGSFLVSAVLMLILMMFAYSADAVDYMTVYFSEGVYKTVVAILVLASLFAIRHFSVDAMYFAKDKEIKGKSFLVGYGFAPAFIVALYCLFSFVYVAVSAMTSDFVRLTEESVLEFANSTVISVFTPFSTHIWLSVLFVVYGFSMFIHSKFLDFHSKHRYKWYKTLIVYCIISLCEITSITIAVFSLSKINLVYITVIVAFLTALSEICFRIIYRFDSNETGAYHSQFE